MGELLHHGRSNRYGECYRSCSPAYKEKGAEAFTIRAGNEEVSGLDGIFHAGRKWVRVTDEDGNLDELASSSMRMRKKRKQ